jgi:hypothetical protein
VGGRVGIGRTDLVRLHPGLEDDWSPLRPPGLPPLADGIHRRSRRGRDRPIRRQPGRRPAGQPAVCPGDLTWIASAAEPDRGADLSGRGSPADHEALLVHAAHDASVMTRPRSAGTVAACRSRTPLRERPIRLRIGLPISGEGPRSSPRDAPSVSRRPEPRRPPFSRPAVRQRSRRISRPSASRSDSRTRALRRPRGTCASLGPSVVTRSVHYGPS